MRPAVPARWIHEKKEGKKQPTDRVTRQAPIFEEQRRGEERK